MWEWPRERRCPLDGLEGSYVFGDTVLTFLRLSTRSNLCLSLGNVFDVWRLDSIVVVTFGHADFCFAGRLLFIFHVLIAVSHGKTRSP